jgi:hypothetical protein
MLNGMDSTAFLVTFARGAPRAWENLSNMGFRLERLEPRSRHCVKVLTRWICARKFGALSAPQEFNPISIAIFTLLLVDFSAVQSSANP